jgi:hypothetical protein
MNAVRVKRNRLLIPAAMIASSTTPRPNAVA